MSSHFTIEDDTEDGCTEHCLWYTYIFYPIHSIYFVQISILPCWQTPLPSSLPSVLPPCPENASVSTLKLKHFSLLQESCSPPKPPARYHLWRGSWKFFYLVWESPRKFSKIDSLEHEPWCSSTVYLLSEFLNNLSSWRVYIFGVQIQMKRKWDHVIRTN